VAAGLVPSHHDPDRDVPCGVTSAVIVTIGPEVHAPPVSTEVKRRRTRGVLPGMDAFD